MNTQRSHQRPYLHHEILDGLLQVVNTTTHLVYSSDDGVRHLAEPILLQRALISFVPTDAPRKRMTIGNV